MSDLEFVKAYLAKHVELLGDRASKTKTSLQMKFAHLGMIDEECMSDPTRWFTDEEMGKGRIRRGSSYAYGGLNKDPVTIFVYAFIRDNLELFRKPDECNSTCSIIQSH